MKIEIYKYKDFPMGKSTMIDKYGRKLFIYKDNDSWQILSEDKTYNYFVVFSRGVPITVAEGDWTYPLYKIHDLDVRSYSMGYEHNNTNTVCLHEWIRMDEKNTKHIYKYVSYDGILGAIMYDYYGVKTCDCIERGAVVKKM